MRVQPSPRLKIHCAREGRMSDHSDGNADRFNHSSGQVPAGPAKTGVEARQGVISGRVGTVLIVSVWLAILAMVVAYLVS